MRVVLYDSRERSPVGLSWAAGARMMCTLGVVDVVIPCTSWTQALTTVAGLRGVEQVQFWGHGSPGGVYINGDKLTADDIDQRVRDACQALRPTGLWWFRTCATFAGAPGQGFAAKWAAISHRRVAASTFNIGFPWHSGVHSVVPGQSPAWSTSEGISDGRVQWSSARAPHTVTTWSMSIPEDW